ncbi:MAG: DNA methyltransferase [Candidatus Poribacteria bacterium]|nr:DNA methyltransferase [Candidatus Poribacteria bacterium]
MEINPFLVWLGDAKTSHYSPRLIKTTSEKVISLLRILRSENASPVLAPPIHNINRWWNPQTLSFLCKLKKSIDEINLDNERSRTLLLLAFCRTMMKLSKADFNHQSMSFKDYDSFEFFGMENHTGEYEKVYSEDLKFVLSSASDNPVGSAEVINGDARFLNKLVNRKFNLVITSPPYANRMSYIRELRPYMYWMGFLNKTKEAGELDWQAIGGTWGIATSRLSRWERSGDSFRPAYFAEILNSMNRNENKNGSVLSKYVDKYFEDIWTHLNSLRTVMASYGRVHYIVGNSTFYGVLLPTEKIYADMLRELGFSEIKVKTLRKRNSKKELFEFDVSGVYRG